MEHCDGPRGSRRAFNKGPNDAERRQYARIIAVYFPVSVNGRQGNFGGETFCLSQRKLFFLWLGLIENGRFKENGRYIYFLLGLIENGRFKENGRCIYFLLGLIENGRCKENGRYFFLWFGLRGRGRCKETNTCLFLLLGVIKKREI